MIQKTKIIQNKNKIINKLSKQYKINKINK